MKLLSLLLLLSCASTRDVNRTKREDCIIKLVREEVSDQVAHIICKDIYERKSNN